jgi:hypothetical protein
VGKQKKEMGQQNTVTAKQSLHCKSMLSRHSYGDAAASVYLMMMVMMITMAMMTVVLVIVGVLMLSMKAISQQI